MPPALDATILPAGAFYGFLALLTLAAFWLSPGAGIFLLAFLALTWSISKREDVRLASLAASRPGEDLCSFARALNIRDLDTWVVRAVYEELQSVVARHGMAFPIRAKDLLIEDLGVDDDDLDMDIVPAVAARAGRSLENHEANPFWGNVQTVEDLIGCLNAQPRVSELVK